MGNAVVKEGDSPSSAASSASASAASVTEKQMTATTNVVTTAAAAAPVAPRKHSTVSTARLLLCGEKIEFLTEEQKGHIRTCWKRIEDDVARVGVITFIQLFETHPDVKEVFMPFNGIKVEELHHSKQLRAHALRVMAFVQKAVARLDEKEKLDKLLEELGKAHYYYGAPKKYIDLIGPQFVDAIARDACQEIWCKEIHDSWLQLFRYISHHMKEALTSAERAKRGSK